MVRIGFHVELHYDVGEGGGDFVLNIQPAMTCSQAVSSEMLMTEPPVPWVEQLLPGSRNRLIRVSAPAGPFHVTYRATVDMRHYEAVPETLVEIPIGELPCEVMQYLLPSRYCESDRLVKLAVKEFGQVAPGGPRVLAIMDWVRRNVTYTVASSSTGTTAVDTLVDQAGVCRDFAHLMIALCRAVNLPARFVTGTDYGANPDKAPDFHAYVEVYLSGRWYIFDPSGTGIPMGFMRIGTGRDAADVPFAMMFRSVSSNFAPFVRADAVVDEAQGLRAPVHVAGLLSTDPGDPL